MPKTVLKTGGEKRNAFKHPKKHQKQHKRKKGLKKEITYAVWFAWPVPMKRLSFMYF